MQGITVVLVSAETVIFLCTAVLASLTYRAYRRSQSRALGALWTGLTLVMVGALLGALLAVIGQGSVELAASASATFTAMGFIVLTYSMYAEAPAHLTS